MAAGYWVRVTLDEGAGCPPGASNTALIYVNGDQVGQGLLARGQKKCDHYIAQTQDFVNSVAAGAPGAGAMTLSAIMGRSALGPIANGTEVPTLTIRNITSAKNVSLKMLPSLP